MSWKIAVAVRPSVTSSCSVYVVVTPIGKRLLEVETIDLRSGTHPYISRSESGEFAELTEVTG